MTRLRISVDLGPSATVGELATVVGRFSLVADLALRWSEVGLRDAAVADVELTLVETREVGRFAEQLSEQERSELDSYFRAASLWEDFGRLPPDIYFEEWYHLFRRRGKRGLPLVAAAWSPLVGPPRVVDAAPRAFSRLVGVELSERLDGPPTVESMRYENPWEIVLTAAASFLGGGALTGLLVLGRDWRSGKRQAAAEAVKVEVEADKTSAEAREINARASQEETKARVLAAVADELLARPAASLNVEDLRDLLEEDGAALDALADFAALGPVVEELPELESPA